MDVVSPELLRRYDVSGPRYTSYPTADRFVEAFGMDEYVCALEQRKTGAAAMALPLSIYVHVPFCESLCYLGLKLETVSRTFSKFVEDGVVEVKQRHVRILNTEALKTIVNPQTCH